MHTTHAVRLATSIAILGLTTACTSLARLDTVGAAPASSRPHPRNARTVIARDEIQDARARNAYDLVQRLCPEYLHDGVAAPGEPVAAFASVPRVYVDGLFLASGVAGLTTIPAEKIAEVRYLDADAPNNWYGVYGNRRAVILAETRP